MHFPDEPADRSDAIVWNIMLRNFYAMNLERACIHGDAWLHARNVEELQSHVDRLQQLECGDATVPTASPGAANVVH